MPVKNWTYTGEGRIPLKANKKYLGYKLGFLTLNVTILIFYFNV